jgi:hypothetical protein
MCATCNKNGAMLTRRAGRKAVERRIEARKSYRSLVHIHALHLNVCHMPERGGGERGGEREREKKSKVVRKEEEEGVKGT